MRIRTEDAQRLTDGSGLAAFRRRYRDAIPRYYSGSLHLCVIASLCLALIAASLVHIDSPSWWERLLVPATWIVANLVEYHAHRGPMHRPWRLLGAVSHRHVGQHHRFFSDEEMSIGRSVDVRAVLFPPVMQCFFLSLIHI